ncbi:hypothetical protein ABIE87_006518 [Bradyrhizobium diazoefficiens]|jgi:hypothetical protein|uniref:hypothetical protein n=1 Tax=Bradyrhizobium diazoefficiens TaxID=1355477 RepID=UPI0035165A0B
MTTCINCQFHHSIPFEMEDGTKGDNHFCRRYPPSLVNANQSAMVPTSPASWCGEHVEKVQKTKRTTKSRSSAS